MAKISVPQHLVFKTSYVLFMMTGNFRNIKFIVTGHLKICPVTKYNLYYFPITLYLHKVCTINKYLKSKVIIKCKVWFKI